MVKVDYLYGWHSFQSLLAKYSYGLKETDKYLEWGPGYSTQLMVASKLPNENIYSVEHSKEWFEKYKDFGVTMKFSPDPMTEDYINPFPNEKFKLILVDGYSKSRTLCLDAIREKNILAKDGIVLVHDAQRPEYQSSMQKYKIIDYENFFMIQNFCVSTVALIYG